MSDLVEIVLKHKGPCVSTALVAALVKEYGLTPATARQRVSRATSVKKLAHILFPHRARFVYLQSDYGSPEFWIALTRDLLANSVSYGGGLAALLARGGAMPVAHFTIACGAPVAQKGHLSPAAVLDRLVKAKLVQLVPVPGIGSCVELSHQSAAQTFELARMRARLHTEQILLGAIKDWARNLGLVSYNKVALRDEGENLPKVGTFHWDLAGPSYLGPLAKWSGGKPKPGFVVCDVLLGVNVSANELQPFLNKCKTLRSLIRVGPCLQIFVADGFTPEAYAQAKADGVIPATTTTLFGVEVAKALRELTELLREVYPRAGTFEKVDAVFAKLSHIEGAANNLRGALFEYLVAETVRSVDAHTTIRMNEIIRDDEGGVAEVDVMVEHRDQSVRFIECKGYRPGGTVPDDMVERWLNDRIPIMWRATALNPFWRKCRYEFEFWTSGRLTPEAAALVAEAGAKRHKYGIKVVAGDALAALGQATNNTALKKTLQEHFLGHPLQKAERVERASKRPLPIPPRSKLATR